MAIRTTLVAGALGLILAGCGGSAGPDAAIPGGTDGTAARPADDASAGMATGAADERATAGVQVGTVVPRGEPGATASTLVTPSAGGSITLDLGDGLKALLEIPVGAVREEVLVSLRSTRSGSVRGLLMEPDGLLLLKPAILSLSPPAEGLLRIGAQADGDLYAVPATTASGGVLVARLRPAVIADGAVEPTVLTADWPGPRPPAPGFGDPVVDQVDGQAVVEEQRESAEPDERVDDPQAAQDLAAAWVPTLTERCADSASSARARLAAARQSAGEQAPAALPDCLTRAVVVFASLETQMGADGVMLVDTQEHVGGEADVSNEVEENLVPLQGEFVGEDRTVQLMVDAMRESDLDYEYGLRKDIAQDLIDSLPEDATCRFNVPLEDGRMSVRLEVLGSGELAVEGPEFDDGLKVTLQPLDGSFQVRCGGKEQSTPAQVWGIIREIKGMGDNEPFVFVFPRGKQSTSVFSNMVMMDDATSKLMSDGTLVLSVEGFVSRASMNVSVYESMKALDQERRDAEAAGASKPR